MDHQAFAQLLGNYGEFVGAIAVVVTLAYLAIQIRQNNRQSRAEAHIAINSMASKLESEIRDDPTLASVVLRGNADWDRLAPQEQFRAHMWNLQEMKLTETYFSLAQQGLLDEHLYEEREAHTARRLASPGMRKWWDEVAYNLDPVFQQRMNEVLASPLALRPMQSLPLFDAANWTADQLIVKD